MTDKDFHQVNGAKSVCKLNKRDSTGLSFVNGGRIIVQPSERSDVFNYFLTSISHIYDEPNLPAERHETLNILLVFFHKWARGQKSLDHS